MKKILMSSANSYRKNGVTNVILNIYKNIDRTKFQVDFVSMNEPDPFIREEIEKLGGKITIIPRSMAHPIRYIKEYAKACKGYDIVHIHGNSATLVLELIGAKWGGVPRRIVHSHNSTCKYLLVDKLCRPLFYSLTTDRVACGELAGKWLYGKREFIVINNGVDAIKFGFNMNHRQRIREQSNFEGCKVIGHVGTFIAAKNHEFLIDIFNEVYKRDMTYRLLLLGDGSLKSQLEDKVKSLGLQGVVAFAGSTDKVADYLNAMDMIVMPSIYEGFPLTLVEEQSNGLPCLVSDVITTDVNLTGNVQFVGLNESPAYWAEQVLKIQVEPDRTKVSDAAIVRIKTAGFDIHTSVKSLEEIYGG